MKRTTPFVAAIILCAAVCTHADYSFTDSGNWPKSWPKELEPLRKQARTFVGPVVLYRFHAINFTKREDSESAWPHLLKVKSKGGRIILSRSPNFFASNSNAGVVLHCPPAGKEDPPANEEATDIELVVDGTIIDLNRIPLPPDTVIVDRRFKDEGAAGKK